MPFPALVVPRAENQLTVLGIKALFALPFRFAEVVVVTRDLIQDQLAVDQRSGQSSCLLHALPARLPVRHSTAPTRPPRRPSDEWNSVS
jgi:hypothetical protein